MMPMAELDVPARLREAASGDDAAWAVLVEAYSRRVFGLLVRQCGDRELAEELTQVTFVTLVHTLGRGGTAGYQERGKFEAWLFRVAMNKLRDEMRRRKRQARPTDMTAGAASGSAEQTSGWAAQQTRVVSGISKVGEDPLAAVSRAEQIDLLRAKIAELPEQDRELLHLRHTAGLSFAQIAETLEQPLGTVLARGHRALKKLKTMMTETAA